MGLDKVIIACDERIAAKAGMRVDAGDLGGDLWIRKREAIGIMGVT